MLRIFLDLDTETTAKHLGIASTTLPLSATTSAPSRYGQPARSNEDVPMPSPRPWFDRGNRDDGRRDHDDGRLVCLHVRAGRVRTAGVERAANAGV